MELGLIGLGKMGGDMTRRLVKGGHRVVVFDTDTARARALEREGAVAAGGVAELAGKLQAPRAVWIMVPHGAPTSETIAAVLAAVRADDIIVDGGNSQFETSQAAAARCAARGVHFLDVGVSGGVWGLEEGYCLMAGGPRAAYDRLEPVLATLAPAQGYAHVGPSGAGHFVKMIHNAIEYAMLQALGEGFECLHRSDLRVDLRQVAELWGHGAVVRSRLLELLGRALAAEGNALERVQGAVDDSGTGRWTVAYAMGRGIPLPAITDAVNARFASRAGGGFAARVVAALRGQFGGHLVHREPA